MYYNFLKDKNSWIRSLIYIGIAIVVAIILPLINYIMIKDINVAILNDALGLIYILLGFSYGNHMRYQYERDNASYGKKIPLDLKVKIKRFRYPLYFAGLVSILIGETLNLIFTII